MLTLKDMTNDDIRNLTELIGCACGLTLVEEQPKEYQLLCENSFAFVPYFGVNIHRLEYLVWDREKKYYGMKSCGYLFFDKESGEYLFTSYKDEIIKAIYDFTLSLGNEMSESKIKKLGFVYNLDYGEVVKKYSS